MSIASSAKRTNAVVRSSRHAGSRRKARQGGRKRRAGRSGKAPFEEGFGHGYREGVQTGIQSFSSLFEGTSIIIPTYNQLDLLKQCIRSIMQYTDLSYEIIVVDNGSTDGTADYLRKLAGTIRSRILDRNHGFAGAVNIGLMMAKGETLLLLNNDTLVTDNWLDNLLICLRSDPSVGMVGPVTNYIGGEQLTKVPYMDLRDMPAFAKSHNVSDAARWRATDRLVGFCLLMSRSLFQQVGYLDEGFELGNFEDDDLNLRVRLLGKRLLIAGDTFIHHFGSVSIKALGDRFNEVNKSNERYYMDKWQQWPEWMGMVRNYLERTEQDALEGMVALFPGGLAVQGTGADFYWVEGGIRRRIEGVVSFPHIRVSQIELRQWSAGEPIAAEDAEHLWRRTEDDQGEPLGVVQSADGTIYYLEGNVARRIAGPAALQGWNLHLKPSTEINVEKLTSFQAGLPIIAPPLLRQEL